MYNKISNEEAEKIILSSVILDPDALLVVSDTIGPEDFYWKSHRQIFSACLDIYQLGGQLDAITLTERLKTKNEIDEIGGISYIAELLQISPIISTVKNYAKIIKEKSILRRVKAWANNTMLQADSVEDIRSWMGTLEREIVDLSQKIIEKKSPYATSIISSLQQEWELIHKGDERFLTFEHNLDAIIPVFLNHLWMIGGYTSNGKSSLLNQIIVDACENGIRPLIFTLEDSREDKMMKLIANIADVRQKDLILGRTQGHEDKIIQAMDVIKKWNPIIYDDVYAIEEIRLKAKKHKLQDDIGMVCVDYVQNIVETGELYRDMRTVSIQLDRLKKELKVTVIALSQVTNESMKNNSEIIGLKGAGELASAADIVLWLKRVKGEDKERWLDCEVRKNRPFGETGIVPLMFSQNWTRIENRGF